MLQGNSFPFLMNTFTLETRLHAGVERPLNALELSLRHEAVTKDVRSALEAAGILDAMIFMEGTTVSVITKSTQQQFLHAMQQSRHMDMRTLKAFSLRERLQEEPAHAAGELCAV